MLQHQEVVQKRIPQTNTEVVANSLSMLSEKGVPRLCVDCNFTKHSLEYIRLPVYHKPFIKSNHKFHMGATSFLFITDCVRWWLSTL